jgi:SAM-dependent methyltransferase
MINDQKILAEPAVTSESLQQRHYERIAAEYDVHYNDRWSREYMRRFVFEPMFDGIDLTGKSVLEAMCGGGQTAGYLLEKGAAVTGLDISPQQASNFKRRHPKASVLCGSILDSGILAGSFDVVSVVGGIHHMPPHVNESIREMHRLLKPGGHLCFMEPHSESAAEVFRRTWYRFDPLFAENEAAINMSSLHNEFAGSFEFKRERYSGNLGYLLVLNSMVFRMPHFLKRAYSPAIMRSERIFDRVLGKRFSCFVVAQWQKR